jgi:branched-chain amino acid transport system ATP-binding protein
LFPALTRRAKQPAIFLSGGERQVLAIGACLLSSPRLLIVDEASLGLAPIVRRQVLDTLAQLNRELGLTVLIVDQDVAGVLSIASPATSKNGRVAFAGTRADSPTRRRQEFYLGQKDGRTRLSRRQAISPHSPMALSKWIDSGDRRCLRRALADCRSC